MVNSVRFARSVLSGQSGPVCLPCTVWSVQSWRLALPFNSCCHLFVDLNLDYFTFCVLAVVVVFVISCPVGLVNLVRAGPRPHASTLKQIEVSLSIRAQCTSHMDWFVIPFGFCFILGLIIRGPKINWRLKSHVKNIVGYKILYKWGHGHDESCDYQVHLWRTFLHVQHRQLGPVNI